MSSVDKPLQCIYILNRTGVKRGIGPKDIVESGTVVVDRRLNIWTSIRNFGEKVGS